MNLKRVTKAHGSEAATYETTDGAYRIVAHKGRTWSGRLGSHAYVQWVAFDLRVPFDAAAPYVAEASKLESLKRRLAKYIADREAGCVRHHSAYCAG